MTMNHFIGVLKSNPDGAYDFICNNYYKMDKDELKDIVKELLFAIHTRTTKAEHDKILFDVADELKDFYSES